MCVLAHPDDESLGTLLERWRRVRHEASRPISLTANQRGAAWPVSATTPSRRALPSSAGPARPNCCAAAFSSVCAKSAFLDYRGRHARPGRRREAIGTHRGHLRRVKPHVVITFGPEGAYGHPDHIAISQLTTSAIVCAADPGSVLRASGGRRIASPSCTASPEFAEVVWVSDRAAKARVHGDGQERQGSPWPDWAITTVIDTSENWPTVGGRCRATKTQMSIYQELAGAPWQNTSAHSGGRRSSTASSAA